MAQDECDLLCLDLEAGEQIRSELPARELVAGAASIAKALSDPTRLEIAVALSHGKELCGCDIAWICGRQQNLVSHHLRSLRHAGLVDSRREGKMVMHSLTDHGRAMVETVLIPAEIDS